MATTVLVLPMTGAGSRLRSILCSDQAVRGLSKKRQPCAVLPLFPSQARRPFVLYLSAVEARSRIVVE